MFKRRKPKEIFLHVRDFFWPRMGWLRTFSFYKHKLIRTKDSNYSVAAGFALGAAISFTPLYGTHLIQCFAIGLVFRMNFIAAAIGSLIGNPWTFPFMWGISYLVGTEILNFLGYSGFSAMPENITLEFLLNHPFKLLFPWVLGGYLCMLLSFPFFYFPIYSIVKAARSARVKAIRKKFKKKENKKNENKKKEKM